MARKTFEIIGDKEVVQALRNAGNVVDTEGTLLMNALGSWGAGRVKAYTMDAGSVDTGEFVQGIHHDTKKTPGTIETTIKPSPKSDKYAAPLEYGSRPHMPPIAALQGWADRHGIPVWAVALKIARDGTEPRYMWRDGFDDLNKHTDNKVRVFAGLLASKL